jgi:hypothetical protein
MVKKGSKRYFKTIVTSIMAWFKVRKHKYKNQFKKRAEIVNEIDSRLSLYTDIAKAWLIKSIKQPLLSIVLDQTLNLSIVDYNADGFEL